jgi:hypothetical protein
VNSRTGNTVPLTGPALANPIFIPRATDNSGNLPINSTTTQLLIDNSNSNANAFIENMPDKIGYSLSLYTNPNGNTANYNDFIYYDRLMEVDLNMEMPLSLIATSLTLCDTADMDITSNDLSKILGGYMTIIADNGFPFNTQLQMYTINSSGQVTDSLLGSNLVIAAPVDATGRVREKKRSRITIPVDQRRIDILQDATKLRIISRFDTRPAGTLMKIYSDYTIDFIITGDFTYRK